MDGVSALTAASVLACALNAIGGTEPQFVNISGNHSFKMCISFSIPSTDNAGVMHAIAAVGASASTPEDAEQSASVAAMHLLWQDHGRVIVDYSLERVWYCKERHAGLLEKLQARKSSFQGICGQSLAVVNTFLPASLLFVQKIQELRVDGADDATVSSATSCVAFLQMMHVCGTVVHQEAMNQFNAMNNHGSLGMLLRDEGLILPDRNDNLVNETGGILMMMERVADMLDFNVPVSRIENRGDRYKCFIDFSPVVAGGRHGFVATGHVPSSAKGATEIAIYNALLSLSVNYDIEIHDVHCDAYLFAKDRVDEVGSELVVLGSLGSSICSYLNTTRRGLRRMIGSYSHLFRGYASREALANKLLSLLSELQQCLQDIIEPVRSMNEDVVVGSLPF